MFKGVTCGNLNTSNTIRKDLFVEESYDICPSATKLYNVSTSEDGMYIRYCGNSLFNSHGNVHILSVDSKIEFKDIRKKRI